MDNTLYIQYSPRIPWDYTTGRLPSGNEAAWVWEESYIPIEHKLGSRTIGKHEFMRIKVGLKGVWSNPIALQGKSIESVSTTLKTSSNGINTYAITTRYTDGSSEESSTYLVIKDGIDGKDGADAINYDTASEWFDTEVELKAFNGYVDGQYYGIFDNKSIYKYSASATVGIKPDAVSGSGRYVFQYDLNSDFATETDMDANPMVLSTKAVAPSTLQYWWDNQSIYTESEVDTLLGDKVDKVLGYGLSENDFTDALKTKLDGIEAGAEVNVNADWNAVSGDAQILNKPSTFTPSAHNHVIADTTGLQTALDGKLNKTLTQGKTWVGDGSNLPSEVFPDALNGYVTVGTGGQYTTMKAAIDAGKYNMLQVGDINENTTFALNNNYIVFRGNGVSTLTISVAVTVSTASTMHFYNTKFTNSTTTTFSTTNGAYSLFFTNCILNLAQPLSSAGASTCFMTFTSSTVTVTSNAALVFYAATCVYNSKFTLNSNRLYLIACNGLELLGVAESINIYGSGCTGISGTATTGGIILNEDQTYLVNCKTPNLYVRSSNATHNVYAVNCSFLNIGTFVANQVLNFTNTRFAQGGNMTSAVGSKSKFENCYFGTALTLASDVVLDNCETTGLTLSGTKNTISGGRHTTITVNGNNNTVTGIAQATSIALGAVTGCNVTNNQVDTDITIVVGNTIHSNSIY